MLIPLSKYRDQYLDVTQPTARTWCEQGLLPAKQIRGRWYVETESTPKVPERVELGRRWLAAISTKEKAGNRYQAGHPYHPRKKIIRITGVKPLTLNSTPV